VAEPTVARLDVGKLERGLFGANDAASAGLAIGDPRLDAITDAAFKSSYGEAAGLAQQVWNEGVRDVRLVGYLLYGLYLEKDVGALAWVFAQLTAVLTDKWALIGPANKLKSADNALNWLFQTLVRQLEGRDKLKDDKQKAWSSPEGMAAFVAAVTAAGPLIEAVGALLPQGKCLDKARHLNAWLSEQQRALDAAAAERERERDAASAAAAPPPAPVAAGAPAAEAPVRQGNGNGNVTIEGAAPMALLLRKIKLFEQLVGREELQKAAVVARDVDQLVQSFDPIVFLPKIFVPFFRLMSKNMEQLEPMMAQLEAPTFKSLVQLYQADLDAFAEP
jgi:hypothetical protein